jgi:periplasmic protein CpxP/Spy
MTKLSSKIRQGTTAIAIAAGLTTSLFALAQPGPGYGPGMMGGSHGMMMGNGPGRMMASNDTDFAKFQQDRLGQLKLQLKITPAQQPAWDAFASSAAEQAKTMRAMRKDMATGTAPERMARHQQVMGERQKAMGVMSEPFTKLYEVLSPQQREVFDRSHGPMRHG